MSQRVLSLSTLELVEMLAFAHEYKGAAIAAAMAEFESRNVSSEEHERLLAEVYDRRHQRDRDSEAYQKLIYWLQRKLSRRRA